MVLFFDSNALAPETPSVQLYMGIDKVENEFLIRFATRNDVWFHVDKLSSAHVYLRLPKTIGWEEIPEGLLIDAAQLVKANSIVGNKKDNLTIIYTPASNLKKSGDMAVGQVSFHADRSVRRVHIRERDNAIINRLNKTKVVKVVDHEAENIEREKEEARERRAAAVVRSNADLTVSRERKALAEAKTYSHLQESKGTLEEEDQEWISRRKEGDFDPEEDFM